MAFAQDETPGPRIEQLEDEFSDPLTTLPQIFTQDAYTPVNYGTAAPTNRVIARLIVPRLPEYSLFPFVQLVRPSFSLVTVPTGRGGATRTAFGDMQLFDRTRHVGLELNLISLTATGVSNNTLPCPWIRHRPPVRWIEARLRLG